MGITEQTDAVVVVVSEETGGVSLVERGRIVRNIDQPRLVGALADLLEHEELPSARIPAAHGCAPTDAATAAPAPPARPQALDAADQHHANGQGRMRRVADFVLRNWPLKLGAILLATVLYSGLVLAENVRTWTGEVPIDAIRPPAGATLLNELPPVTADSLPRAARRRRPVARFVPRPGRPLAMSTRNPAVHRSPMPVTVVALDPRVQVVDYEPRQVQVQLDPVEEREVPVNVELGSVPDGLTLGPPQVDPSTGHGARR